MLTACLLSNLPLACPRLLLWPSLAMAIYLLLGPAAVQEGLSNSLSWSPLLFGWHVLWRFRDTSGLLHGTCIGPREHQDCALNVTIVIIQIFAISAVNTCNEGTVYTGL